ncbi:MAG: GldG family protein [Deltaproteobacteria bacterium]|nr:GldG family protein [Deltaproteobacteria bacterium]
MWGVALGIALAAIHFLSGRHYFRWDLTDNRQFSLAPATKEILRSLDDVVTIRAYFTPDLPPAVLSVKTAVEDLLAEYRSVGGERIRVEYVNPQASPQSEQETQILGIAPLTLNVVQQDRRETKRIYLGLALFHGDRKHLIPVINRPEQLEYELTAGIVRVTQSAPTKIGWWGPLPPKDEAAAASDKESYGLVYKRIEQRYTVVPIRPNESDLSPATLSALAIVAPRDLTEKQRQAVERYLAAGGKVLALVDRMEVSSQTLEAKAVTSGLEPLFAAYGVTLNADLVVDASNAYAAFGNGEMTVYQSYPFWPVLHRPHFSPTHPTVSRLEKLTLPWVSSLTIGTVPHGITATTLVQSSPANAVKDGAAPFSADPNTALAALAAASPTGTPRPLAVLLEGAFGEASAGSGQLLVVGTSRMIEDRPARQFAEGVVFFENALDYLASGAQLIGIRSRAIVARPLPPLSDAARAAIKMGATFGVPLVVIALGLVAMARRRRRYRLLRLVYASAKG